MYNNYFSFADYIVSLIVEVHNHQELKRKHQIILEHHKLSGKSPEDTNAYIIKYRRFSAIYPPDFRSFIEPFMAEPLHESLIPEVKEMDELHAEFAYDMDKLKNFISYVIRYAMSADLIHKYIPKYFLDRCTTSYPYPGGENPPELYSTIESKFSEEIPLLKKYFLMVKLHEME